jgi:hypothetical protein
MRIYLTEKEKKRVEAALRAKRFTGIAWRGDKVECSHRSHKGMNPKGIGEIVRGIGFYVPCSGVAERAYCQVWVDDSTLKQQNS